jgi:hypothetical protein
MRTMMIAAAGLVFAFVRPTLADITIQTAKIAQGKLMIIGTVPPHTPKVALIVSAGIEVEVTPDRRGRFVWKDAKFPSTCSVEVRAGNERKNVLLAYCGVAGPPELVARAESPVSMG